MGGIHEPFKGLKISQSLYFADLFTMKKKKKKNQKRYIKIYISSHLFIHKIENTLSPGADHSRGASAKTAFPQCENTGFLAQWRTIRRFPGRDPMAGDCPHSGTGPCSGRVEPEFVLGPTLEMWNENGLLQSCNSLLIFKTFFF